LGVISRDPDIYNTALSKLFYAPWRARQYRSNAKQIERFEVSLQTPIADIIEKGGLKTVQIMEKHGLYCAGCHTSIAETLKDGCRIHGLDDDEIVNLCKELQNNESLKN